MKLANLALFAVGSAGLFWLFKPKERFIGDRAKAGDIVQVPTISLPPGALPAIIPQGVGSIEVTVSTETGDTLDGLITGYVLQTGVRAPITPGIGPVQVQRSTITQVTRSGKVVQ